MTFNPQKHHRRSIRLPEYDYSQPGGYYITIDTKMKQFLFGDVVDGKMVLNGFGKIAEQFIHKITERYPNVELDEWIVMTNHVHFIVMIGINYAPVRAIHESPQNKATEIKGVIRESPIRGVNENSKVDRRRMLIPKIVGYFKMNTAKQINLLRGTSGTSLWHRDYYEHVIRDEEELNGIRRYIFDNSVEWEKGRK